MTTKTHAIFDLDNCLSDDRERIPLIDWTETVPEDRYRAYHAACGADPSGNLPLFCRVTNFHKPIFLTARPVAVRAETIDWIQRKFSILDPMLLMRNNGDNRPSAEVKREMLGQLLEYGVPRASIAAAYDDQESIVEMYRQAGIEAHRVYIHQIETHAPPLPPIDVPAALADRRRAEALLAEGAETFRNRNATYGDTYLEFGRAMVAAFPRGLQIAPGDVEGFNRLGVYVQALGKLLRYGPTLSEGGHRDSAHDLMVYGALLEEVTK